MILAGLFDLPFVRRVASTLHPYGMPYALSMMLVWSDARERPGSGRN
jgi:hypothetical protein